jgi:hypothetical protein
MEGCGVFVEVRLDAFLRVVDVDVEFHAGDGEEVGCVSSTCFGRHGGGLWLVGWLVVLLFDEGGSVLEDQQQFWVG